MHRTMSDIELNKYICNMGEQSNHFKMFLEQYVTGDTYIRGRREEDTTIWSKLKGDELEIAKQIILDELKSYILDESYIRAVGFFKDSRAIPILKNIIKNAPDRFVWEKLLSAKILYEWIGYDEYISMLEAICSQCSYHKDLFYEYLKMEIGFLTSNLNYNIREKILKNFSK